MLIIHIKAHLTTAPASTHQHPIHLTQIATSKFLVARYREACKPKSAFTSTSASSVPVIEFYMDDHIYFKMYAQWAYRRTIITPREMRERGQQRNQRNQPVPTATCSEHADQDYLALVECMVLAHQIQDMRFKDAVTESLLQLIQSPSVSSQANQLVKYLTASKVNLLYDATTPGSSTRKFLVDVVAEWGKEEDFERILEFHYNKTFVRDLLVPVARLRSSRKIVERDEREYFEYEDRM